MKQNVVENGKAESHQTHVVMKYKSCLGSVFDEEFVMFIWFHWLGHRVLDLAACLRSGSEKKTTVVINLQCLNCKNEQDLSPVSFQIEVPFFYNLHNFDFRLP